MPRVLSTKWSIVLHVDNVQSPVTPCHHVHSHVTRLRNHAQSLHRKNMPDIMSSYTMSTKSIVTCQAMSWKSIASMDTDWVMYKTRKLRNINEA